MVDTLFFGRELLFCLFTGVHTRKKCNLTSVRIKLAYQTTEYSAREMWHKNREARARDTL